VQGLRDASNLAWKLDHVLRLGAPDALLDSYEAERRPHVIATTRAAISLGRAICERDPVKARERDARLLAEHGGTVPTTVRQSMLPELSAGLIGIGSPGAGSLFPQPRVGTVPPACSGWLDDVGGAGVRVLACDEALAPADAIAFEAALAPLQGRLLRLVGAAGDAAPAGPGPGPGPGLRFTEEQTLLADWLRGLGARFAVVRPDHQVYATAAHAADALRHLAGLAGLAAAMGPRGG
jgi:3-(3-hydroxy-phenyl)propionate hydroxylase